MGRRVDGPVLVAYFSGLLLYLKDGASTFLWNVSEFLFDFTVY
jgi:hypothetical protein